MIIGYARVSTVGQELEGQIAALKTFGAERIWCEKVSGGGEHIAKREQLAKAIAFAGEGDTFIVTRLDRLARSTLDLLETLKRLTAKGVGFKSLADPWCNTTTPHGRLLITMLGGVAEFERELIRSRTEEGRRRAKARGVRFGHDFKLSVEQRAAIRLAHAAGVNISTLARRHLVSRRTIHRSIGESVAIEVVDDRLPGQPISLGE